MLRRTAQTSRVFSRANHQISFKPDLKKAEAYKSFAKHTEEHAVGTTSLWRNISLATIPVLALCAWYVYPKEKHHIEHLIELNQLPNEEWPVEMEYQNIRTKKFFWGDGNKSLFWGPTNHINKD